MHQSIVAIVAVEAALIVLNGELAPNSAILIIETGIPSRREYHRDAHTIETRTPSRREQSRNGNTIVDQTVEALFSFSSEAIRSRKE